jgi:peroxiredoxin
MTNLIKRLIKPLICIAIVLFSVNVNAQVSLLQNTIDKLEGYKNFSYQYTSKQKDYTSDTSIIQYKDIFLKAPEDKTVGYLFSMETLDKAAHSHWTNLYNGQTLVNIGLDDSTYEVQEIEARDIQSSLLGHLNLIRDFLEKNPSKIAKTGDTTINDIVCIHLIINTNDTTINAEYYYSRIHLLINKLSGVPDRIIYSYRTASIGDGITNGYVEFHYFGYKFDQDNVNVASMTMPKGFHPRKEPTTLPLLAPGTTAPNWTLEAANGKKMSLAQMKGKVVLLDFFFIGCWGCMESLKPLNKIYEKYKNQNIIIVSLTERDSKRSLLEFEKNYHINYPGYVNAAGVVKSYQVQAFPTFYFIDKEGKIASAFVGYDDDFEGKVSSTVDGLLKR